MAIGEVPVLELLVLPWTAMGGTTDVGGVSALGWIGVGGWTCKPAGTGIAGGICSKGEVAIADGNAEPDVPDMLIEFDAPRVEPVDPGIPVRAEMLAGDDMPSPGNAPGTVTSPGDDSMPLLSTAPPAIECDAGTAPEADMLDSDVPFWADGRALR